MSKFNLSPTLNPLEQQLLVKECQLQKEIKNREHLEQVNKELAEKFQEQERLVIVGQLAAGIVHDFNNIMAVIVLVTQILRRMTTISFPGRRHLKTIEQQAKLANSLIQHILGFCRQTVREKKALNLKPFFIDLVNLLDHILPDNIIIEFLPGKDEHAIFADPSCIEQIIMNLAINARDSQPDGGKLTIKLDWVQLETNDVPSVPAGEWVQITIQDNGIGIHPTILPKIFEPFFTTKPTGNGIGLGLTQVNRLVKEHDGFIDVQSKPGIGTAFRLFFPALTTSDYEPFTMEDTKLMFGKGQQVLVVEDNLDTNEALANSLHLLNYKVIQAFDGREGLEILTNPANKIELIISDMIMPGMNGLALLDAIRQMDITTPFILITGDPVTETIEKCHREALLTWLPKPVDLDDLAGLIAKTISTNTNNTGGSD